MDILLIEDCAKKTAEIMEQLITFEPSIRPEVIVSNTLEDARRNLLKKRFDLIIFDFYLPISESLPDAVDLSSELIAEFCESDNYDAESIAITRYDLKSIEHVNEFNANGVTVVKYSDSSVVWKKGLERQIKKISEKSRYDFLIFCALSKERMAYKNTCAVLGSLQKIKGLNCQEITVDSKVGLCIVPLRMGPVHTAIMASKAIERFQPKLVAMSGICAGFPGEAKMLDIIVADNVWDYSVGKITDEGFKSEPYPLQIDNGLKVNIQQLIEDGSLLKSVMSSVSLPEEFSNVEIIMGSLASGSAVIASREKMKKISEQHRKIVGLEMEIASLYEAANQSLCKPLYIAAKSVVDTGDVKKDDSVHGSACILSAKFIVEIIKKELG